MRLLQVCAVDFTAYHFLLPLMRACRDVGWVVELACANGKWISYIESEGFRSRLIPISRSRSILSQVRAVIALASSLRRDPPDLMHTHTPVGGLVGRFAAFTVPAMPVIHTLHGLPIRSTVPRGVERPFLIAERLAARRTAFFFSQAEGDIARGAALGVLRAADSLVIGNGVNTDHFAPDPLARAEVRAEFGIPSDAVLVISVGRLVREKGHIEFADASAMTSDVAGLHVVLVGEALPSDRTDVGEELDRHAVTQVLGRRWRRVGYRRDVDRLLKAADVFVLASHREGLPRSLIEAMACGLAVIATDIPGCRELIDPGLTGVLIPVGDARALSVALRRLAEDTEFRAAIGSSARRRALDHHREEDVVARQLPVLARFASRP